MHISPPILFPRQNNEEYAAWIMRTMPVDPRRGFPVNGVESWHGGIHIPHTDTGALANPLRAVADGVVVYASYPAPTEKRDTKPLNYDGATDNGCVLIRHEILTGEDPVLCVFYSLTMHMKQVRPEIQGKPGVTVRRGQVIGTTGMVSGQNAYHFQLCCSSDMLKMLCGRDHGSLDVSAPGRAKPVYGHRYFRLPEGTAIYQGSTPYGLSAYPNFVTTEALYIIHEGAKTRTLHKVGDDYQPVGEAAIAVDYICEPTAAVSGHKTYSDWVRVAFPGGEGWVDVSSPVVKTWTDADFPDWAGWTLVDDDTTPDGQCNSATVKNAQEKQDSDFTRFICQFPLEWDFASFDTRFSWLKAPNASLPEPMNNESYAELKEHARALSFFDKLPVETQKELAGLIWHFDPRGLMIQLQKAERRLIYSSANGSKRKKMNDFTVDDMRYGDLTKEQILAQGKLNRVNVFGEEFKINLFDFNKTVDQHFASMDNMAFWTAWGEYTALIQIMLEKFRKNEGGVLRHELLNKAFLEHKTTKECVDKIKKITNELLHNNGFKSLTLEDLGELNLRISKEAKLPKFDDWDWFNGLGITIHDTYSTKVYLDDFEIIETGTVSPHSKKFKLRLTFQIQDHFGLDTDDVNGKGFEDLTWFCSWFILQRYKPYGFKPFINEANFSTWVES
ncbi:DUF3289 family protein [Enterobacter sp. RHBSTW-00994]|uniref:DUF3289 family protein n=1 Tax=Enterobacter sp. RHBSTW-00994 TaxID=2742676 RepID=UPI0015E951BA|nr:DUF3289 family protein [Enterobacter sp. RHBSTW-00994]QLR44654.1 DUF3289 family protein [Enterobacter sp. RHBSTW-00994]